MTLTDKLVRISGDTGTVLLHLCLANNSKFESFFCQRVLAQPMKKQKRNEHIRFIFIFIFSVILTGGYCS